MGELRRQNVGIARENVSHDPDTPARHGESVPSILTARQVHFAFHARRRKRYKVGCLRFTQRPDPVAASHPAWPVALQWLTFECGSVTTPVIFSARCPLMAKKKAAAG